MEEPLPHDVIEYHILVRLAAETLAKFKYVSKQWKSIIESSSFAKRQLVHHHSHSRRDPDVLLVGVKSPYVPQPYLEGVRRLVEGSGSSSVSIHLTELDYYYYDVCKTSCDGLICLFSFSSESPSIVLNPVTRWHRFFPNSQLLVSAKFDDVTLYLTFGFGKDKISGTYKPVWLYNSAKLGLNDNATTCEVFDFATNSWRHVVPACPHLIYHTQHPVYFDGSLNWFTASSQEGETMVLSMDLHTETFQVIAKAPFLNFFDAYEMVMCNLDDRLCVSEKQWSDQVIWSLDSNLKTWKKIYSLDLTLRNDSYNRYWLTSESAFTPLAVLDKDKLLLCDQADRRLRLYDPNTESTDSTSSIFADAVCYFPSLISIL